MRGFPALLVVCVSIGSVAAQQSVAHAASVPPAPVVASVSPAQGSAAGYQPVVIHGRNLLDTSAVSFGATPAASFEVKDQRTVLAVAPPGPAGRRAHVLVETGAGSSPRSTADSFTYIAPASARVRTTHLSGYLTDEASSIDCPAPGWCASSADIHGVGPVIARITGSGYSTIPVPVPTGTISCSAVGSCIALGYGNGVGAVIVTLDNGSVVSVPIDGLGLQDASCTGSVCVAVGGEMTCCGSPSYGAIVERDANGTWSKVPLPKVAYLAHVSCAGATCVALGYFDNPVELVRTADGWRRTNLPLPAGGSGLMPTGVDCYQPDKCVVAGSFVAADGLRHPLFERWDGSAWTAVVAPRPAQLDGDFRAGPMDCTSSGNCYLVGDSIASDNPGSFVARLYGQRAAVTALPIPLDDGPVFDVDHFVLACASGTFCVISGGYETNYPGEYGTLHTDAIVLSNGVWTNQPAAPPSAASCAAPRFCALAGGGVSSSGAVVQTLQQAY